MEEAYICHSVDHWIAIRKLYGVWYNLNSTNMMPQGPQIISDFYLAAFLDSIQQSGFTIFVVRHTPGTGSPLPLPKKQSGARKNQHYISTTEIEKHHKDNKNRKLNTGGADERELEEALQRSLKDMGGVQGGKDDQESAPGVGTVLNAGQKKEQEENKF